MGGWEREGDALTREFELANFVGSVDFVNRLTPVAEEMNHHPDLSISWNKVKVSLSTHSEGGITENDFELANFVGSVDFVNRITPLAEEMNHHPDLSISWNKVTVSLSTHSEGGITENDFQLAAKIDSVA